MRPDNRSQDERNNRKRSTRNREQITGDPNVRPITAGEISNALKGVHFPLVSSELEAVARMNGARQPIVNALRNINDLQLNSPADLERALLERLEVEGSIVDALRSEGTLTAQKTRDMERPSQGIVAPMAGPPEGGLELDLDTVGADELARVQGISRSMAEKIVRYRDAHGGHFEGFEDLEHVPGMTAQTINKLREISSL